jgi:diphosphomevalonate decarboxylase
MVQNDPVHRSFTATSPSNIALVKYWGKRDADLQWPANDSISMTLSACMSVTTARRTTDFYDTFRLGDINLRSDVNKEHKVFRHIQRLRDALNVSGCLEISSKNSFPASCGIASSASGFSALTIAATASLLGSSKWDELSSLGACTNFLTHMARMGSGSAGRSLFGGFVQWTAGASSEEQSVKQLYPIDHWQLADVIVVLSADEKKISSTEAHKAAWGSPLFAPRLAGLPDRIKSVNNAISGKDIELLGREIESEALEMHAVCMTGTPQINYLSEKTVSFFAWLRTERQRGRIPAWATIDAGPNLHLICLKDDAAKVAQLIEKEWPGTTIIMDKTGSGPTVTLSTEDPTHV